jgi:hypothetical protein
MISFGWLWSSTELTRNVMNFNPSFTLAYFLLDLPGRSVRLRGTNPGPGVFLESQITLRNQTSHIH